MKTKSGKVSKCNFTLEEVVQKFDGVARGDLWVWDIEKKVDVPVKNLKELTEKLCSSLGKKGEIESIYFRVSDQDEMMYFRRGFQGCVLYSGDKPFWGYFRAILRDGRRWYWVGKWKRS